MATRGLHPDALTDTGSNVVAFSGGPDSLCLLHLLSREQIAEPIAEPIAEQIAGPIAEPIRNRVVVVHVDHGLDPGSSERAERARQLANDLGFDCSVERVTVDRSGGPEAAARRARYRALAGYVQRGDHLLTAHHADDQVETVLLRLMRGAGPRGLGAMRRKRRFGDGWLTRPLLDWTREQIVEWLAEYHLEPIDDPANQDLALDRNFLRHQIVPQLQQRWPQARATLVRVAELQRDAADAVDVRAESDRRRLENIAPTTHGLPPISRLALDGWLNLAPTRALALLRHWFGRHGQAPPVPHRLGEFRRQCRDVSADRIPVLDHVGLRLACWQGWLWLDAGPRIDSNWNLEWRESDRVELPGGGRMCWRGAPRNAIGARWRLGPPRPGERLRLRVDGPRRKVTELMRVHQIPPWRRCAVPCLRIDGVLRALGPELLEANFARDCERLNASLEWHPDDE